MSITLFTYTNICHELTELSLETSLKALPFDFDEILVFSDKKLKLSKPYTYVELHKGKGIQTRNEYCEFCLKHLNDYIKTDHVLITQYEGMAVNSHCWTDEFLEYDYVGGPINEKAINVPLGLESGLGNKWVVGNGGFSLRSKKLLTALKDPHIKVKLVDVYGNNWVSIEDVAISAMYRNYLQDNYSIKFADVALGLKFSSEYLSHKYSFGFHGIQNIPLFFDDNMSYEYIEKYLKYSKEYETVIDKSYFKTNLYEFYLNTKLLNYKKTSTFLEQQGIEGLC